jgi:hypothetical protein
MNAKIIKDLMQFATRFRQAGLLDQAEKIYQQVLSMRVRPGHADSSSSRPGSSDQGISSVNIAP